MKNQRHAVAGRNLLESSGGGGPIELVRTADDLVEPVDRCLLFIRWADGITNDVDKQNVRNLEADVSFRCFRHAISSLTAIPSCSNDSVERGRSTMRKALAQSRPETPERHGGKDSEVSVSSMLSARVTKRFASARRINHPKFVCFLRAL